VSDPRCRAVYVFDASGTFQFAFDWSPFIAATGIAQPIPRGIVGDSQGNVYVVEFQSRRVVVFNRQGQFVRMLAAQSTMNDPRGLGLDEARGRLYVAAAFHNEVFELALSDGHFITKWTGSGTTPFQAVRYVAVDPGGNFYVGDTWQYDVFKFDVNGNPAAWA